MGLKVLVVGSSSGVGLEVTKSLLERGENFEVYALVRNEDRARKSIGDASLKVNFVPGDLTKQESLIPACEGKDAIVCAVGAQAGWRLPGMDQNTPRNVDYAGVKNLIDAALAAKVPKFALVSSMFVTRPLAFVGILLNTVGGRVLHWKLKSEEFLRTSFKNQEDVAYYIIRPGGLHNKAGGANRIEIDQGDKGSGSISRKDVATVIISCIDGLCVPNVTFEVFNNKNEPSSSEDVQKLSSLVPDQ